MRMNPHPAGQMTHNVPRVNDAPLKGLQHKYKETVLFFPSAGQTCHAYCTFCFRWPQFVGMDDMKFDARECSELVAYLKTHPDVTDVLITGGDPMIMNTRSLAEFIEPLLAPELAHIQNIRIGTKSVAYWPQRFVSDKDADDLMRLFERVVKAGKNLAIMGHYNHAVELRHPIAQQAVKRIVGTGATLRMQGPLIRHINEDPKSWAELWTTGVRLGAIPYYMFVERDTGPSEYFSLPLARAHEIFQQAYQMVSGLSRTVRGPVDERLPRQGRDRRRGHHQWRKAVRAAVPAGPQSGLGAQALLRQIRSGATWLDHLVPAFGKKKFFFEEGRDDAHHAPAGKVIPIVQASRNAANACGSDPASAPPDRARGRHGRPETAPRLSGVAVFFYVFLPFALGHYLSSLLRTVNAVLAPQLVGSLALTPGQLGLLTSAFFFAFRAGAAAGRDRARPLRPAQGAAGAAAGGAAGALMFARGASFARAGAGARRHGAAAWAAASCRR
jgi:KamA family protein